MYCCCEVAGVSCCGVTGVSCRRGLVSAMRRVRPPYVAGNVQCTDLTYACRGDVPCTAAVRMLRCRCCRRCRATSTGGCTHRHSAATGLRVIVSDCRDADGRGQDAGGCAALLPERAVGCDGGAALRCAALCCAVVCCAHVALLATAACLPGSCCTCRLPAPHVRCKLPRNPGWPPCN